MSLFGFYVDEDVWFGKERMLIMGIAHFDRL